MRCKVKLTGITQHEGSKSLAFYPVQSGVVGTENEKFYKSTPSGEIQLRVVNEKACEGLVVGAEYYVDFTKAE